MNLQYGCTYGVSLAKHDLRKNRAPAHQHSKVSIAEHTARESETPADESGDGSSDGCASAKTGRPTAQSPDLSHALGILLCTV